MLILSRRINESIIIGDQIKVSILRYKGGQVRVGIEAPKTVTVNREEVFERMKTAEQE